MKRKIVYGIFAATLIGTAVLTVTPSTAQTVDAAVKTGWVKESGKWYFYKDGVKATGWQEWDGKRYYLNSDGTMKANEWMIDTDGSIYYFRSWGGAYKNCNAVINGRSYTFGADSKMQGSQWIVKGGNWYLAKDGKIATGWQEWQGSKYYLNSDGTMRSNEWRLDDTGKIRYLCSWGGAYKNCWYTSGGKKYYLHDNSAAYQNEWLKADGKWYYFQSDSTMATDTWIDNYYVDASGVWIPSKEKPTDKWITSGNRKWYRHADGSYTKNDWEVIDGKYYRFDKDGWMVTGWQKLGNVTYYMDKTTGERYGEGWHWIDGNCYYMNANGEMAVDTWIDGYYVDESGKWIKDPKNEEHTHKWVEETKTVNHPEESHIEIKHHDAITHTVNHDEEFHYETVNHPEESHMETVHHEEVGHYVHHEAQTHTEYIEHPEVSHEERHTVCGLCGAYMEDDLEAHVVYHALKGESISYSTKTVKVVDQEAWTEEKTVVDKEAWDEWVVDQEAWDEQVKVVDKEAWTETIKQKVCSICGKVQN